MLSSLLGHVYTMLVHQYGVYSLCGTSYHRLDVVLMQRYFLFNNYLYIYKCWYLKGYEYCPTTILVLSDIHDSLFVRSD